MSKRATDYGAVKIGDGSDDKAIAEAVNDELDMDDYEDAAEKKRREQFQFPSGLDPKLGLKTPGDDDILCGRGKSISHRGNRRFRYLIAAKREEYSKAHRREHKTRITKDLMDHLTTGPNPVVRDLLPCRLDALWTL